MPPLALYPTIDVDLDRLADVAARAARSAGRVQRQHFRSDLVVNASEQHDLKLAADVLSEEAILHEIRESFPGHAVLSEECGTADTDSPYWWIIDPLDGTVNYYHGIAYYCTSVSCYHRSPGIENACGLMGLGRPLVGAIYAEQADELFLAVRGRGATLNGQPFTCPKVEALDQAIVSVSIGSKPAVQQEMSRLIADLAPKVRKIRSCGAVALDLAHVATGRFSAVLQRRVRTWDLAAAVLILAEAGGNFIAMNAGDHQWNLIASSASLLKPIEQVAQFA